MYSIMNVIRQVAESLVKRLNSFCPKCKTPGFGAESMQGKLPCSTYGSDSILHKNIILTCIQCEYIEEKLRADGFEFANPAQYTYCNP